MNGYNSKKYGDINRFCGGHVGTEVQRADTGLRSTTGDWEGAVFIMHMKLGALEKDIYGGPE